MLKYTCKICGDIHEGICAFGSDRPDAYWDVPSDKLDTDVELNSDVCIIANRFFFVRGCIEIKINDVDENFEYGVWISLSKESFKTYINNLDKEVRSDIPPMFGWLSTNISFYGNTINHKTMIHLRDNFLRPLVELESIGTQISLDQTNGIDFEKYKEIFCHYVHGEGHTNG